MHMMKKSSMIIMILLLVLLFAGCNTQLPQVEPAEPSSADPSPAQSVEPTTAKQSPESTKSDNQVKEANWVIEIEDTQQITDEEGVIWNYELNMYASKTGGTDVFGEYTGEMILNMSPDMDSVEALASQEGAELLAMMFDHHSEAQNVVFELVPYSQETYADLMKTNAPDDPLLQVSLPSSDADGVAVSRITFQATQEPVKLTVRDNDVTGSGTAPGGKTSVTVPVEVTTAGAKALCYIFETIHPLSRAFTGSITGDVLN